MNRPNETCFITGPLDPVSFARQRLDFHPDPKQTLILMSGARRGIVNCSRQWGKSTTMAVKLLHHALTHPESLVLILSPSERQSGELLRKIRAFAGRLGIPRRGDGSADASILLPNRSRIVALPGSEATTRGFSGVSVLVVDEAARVPDPLFEATVPVLAASNGDLWLISTPDGRRGFFYDIWEYGGEGWLRVSAPATECPRISPDFLASERERKGERAYRQEYLCEFLDAADSLVPMDTVENAFKQDVPPLFPLAGQSNSSSFDYRTFLQTASRYPRHFFLGLDLGKRQDHSALAILERVETAEGRDPLTFTFIRKRHYHLRHLEEFRVGTMYTEVARRLRDILTRPEMIGHCEVVVDATGVGNAVLEMLQAELCPSPGRAACLLVAVTITGGESEGSSRGSHHVPKQNLITALSVPLETGELQIAAQVPCADVLLKQLRDFRATPTESRWTRYAAAGTAHDDLVLALALACWRARQSPIGEVPHRLW